MRKSSGSEVKRVRWHMVSNSSKAEQDLHIMCVSEREDDGLTGEDAYSGGSYR